MLFNKLTTTLSALTAIIVPFTQASVDFEISVTPDNRIQIDVPANFPSFSYIATLQLNYPETFAWSDSGSNFYQCSSNTECEPFDSSDLDMGDDTPYQFYGKLSKNADDGKFIRFLTPQLALPKYGVVPVSFAVLVMGPNPLLAEYAVTIYQLDPASSDAYTYIPTTACFYNYCAETSIPELKQTITSISNGVTQTILTHKSISYEPVTVKSYQTTSTIVSDGVTKVITTYCPLTSTQ